MGQFNLHVYETSVQTVPQHNFIVLWDMKCLHSWFHKAWTQRCGQLTGRKQCGNHLMSGCCLCWQLFIELMLSLLFCFVKKRKLWVTCIYFVLFPVPAQRHFRIYFFMSPNFSSDMFWNITNQSELWWNSDSACLVRLLFWFCVAGRVWQSDTNRTHFCSTQLKRAC